MAKEIAAAEATESDLTIPRDRVSRLHLKEALLPAHAGRPHEGSLDGTATPAAYRRKTSPALPTMSEFEVVRHFTRLSRMNFGIDQGMYPLGSCTMKYNPKFAEVVAAFEGFTRLHPYQDPSTTQGAMALMWELEKQLCRVVGMDSVTLQPPAGAAGEFTGLLIARKFHEANGEGETRDEVIIPDTAHGTNPATAGMCGYKVVEVPSTEEGTVDLEALQAAVGPRTAAIMLTNPSTLGIFESEIKEVARIVHSAGALLYYDGANLNAIMGRARPGDMGFDIVHINLHKTFATPHGGGGPGAGPVGVRSRLEQFLPTPRVVRQDGEGGASFVWQEVGESSIGKVHGFHGNFGMLVRAYAYILRFGGEGLRAISDTAVMNSNWLKRRLKGMFDEPHRDLRKHEFVVSASNVKKSRGIRTLDIAKRLLDHGVHAPTVYFPMVVDEALMIEPTESEPLDEMERFAQAMESVLADDPEVVRTAPHTMPVGRLDEAWAARQLVLTWQDARARIDELAPETDEA